MASASGVSMASVTKSFVFDSDRDKDLLAWLESQGARGQSALVREALRALRQQHHHQDGLSIEDVARACRQAIRQELAGRLIAAEGQDTDGPALLDPESEAARNLAHIEEAFGEWD
jgi:hypothetical protein